VGLVRCPGVAGHDPSGLAVQLDELQLAGEGVEQLDSTPRRDGQPSGEVLRRGRSVRSEQGKDLRLVGRRAALVERSPCRGSEDVEGKRAAHDLKTAQRAADQAEDDAIVAVDFAYAAIGEAEYAVLDATLARREADDMATGAGTGSS
jgi:hypothetical protein